MPDCPQIKEVEKRYAEAETALKSYERITLTNLAPAINQLRYAGYHLLRASSETLSVASILLAIVALGPIRRFILRVSGIDLG